MDCEYAGAYLVAVATRPIDLGGNGNDLVAVYVVVAAGTESNVEPGSLCCEARGEREVRRWKARGILTRPLCVTRFSRSTGAARTEARSAKATTKNVKIDIMLVVGGVGQETCVLVGW